MRWGFGAFGGSFFVPFFSDVPEGRTARQGHTREPGRETEETRVPMVLCAWGTKRLLRGEALQVREMSRTKMTGKHQLMYVITPGQLYINIDHHLLVKENVLPDSHPRSQTGCSVWTCSHNIWDLQVSDAFLGYAVVS